MKRASATIRIDLAGTNADPRTVAEALEPDDTAEMTSQLDGGVLETHVERGSVGGLRSTIDDHIVNLGVVLRVAGSAAGPDRSTDPIDDDDETEGADGVGGTDGTDGTDGIDEADPECSTTADTEATGDTPASDGDEESMEDAKRQE
ncbi:hypothetical protein BRC68_15185 [Halobacteriales archaeon QH_6_64_20]|nr:MAG: hypothetical protein BRC68_15185 [Halobacteriales archaeon QH_6_64_20]